MAEFVREHDAGDFAAILTELTRKRIPNNFDRAVAGHGRSQAFGVIRRWSYRPWLSRNTWHRPHLWQLLQDFASKYDIEYDAIQVNDDYSSQPHRDKGNSGRSYIVGFGDYTAGELVVDGSEHCIRHRGYVFNGSELLHHTKPWVGHRFSLVFFRLEWPSKWPRYSVTCRTVEDGMEVTDTYDESIFVLDCKGHLVRWIKLGLPRPWIGRLTIRGQPARNQQAVSESSESA